MRLLITAIVAAVLIAMGLTITASEGEIEKAPDYEVAGGHAEQGSRLFVKYGCGGCHEIAGIRGAHGRVGPPLTTIGQRAYIAGNLPNRPENLVLWIMNPQGVEPGTAMPNLDVTLEDARSMASYLYSLD
jgi:cytochrome c